MRDQQPFLMAGLWESWRDEAVDDAQPLETFTVLTTSANSLTQELHNRMPVILNSSDYDRWLDTDVQLADELTYLLKPFDSDAMQFEAVSQRVNSVRHDDEQCLEIVRTLF
jgi:putative SOS response-associated peptidase YedK